MGKGEAGEGGLSQLLLGLVSHDKMEALSSGIVESFKPKNRERFVTSITLQHGDLFVRENKKEIANRESGRQREKQAPAEQELLQ